MDGIDFFRDACMSNVTTCLPASCALGFEYPVPHDADLDLSFSEEEFRYAAQAAATPWATVRFQHQ